jgi:L-asparaginase
MRKPRIHLIATGGTIAGTGPNPADSSDYTAGILTAGDLIASSPPLLDLADITVEQLYNIDSKDMTPDHWLGLARATKVALDRDEIDGVVITHGTDTMEESAFFLDLVLPPGKPVVFTGAMRPATALSADGPLNLFQAVGVAAHEDFSGVGVVVVMHGEVHAARYVAKACSGGTARFASPGLGPVGWCDPPQLCLVPHRAPHAAVDLGQIRSLHRVDILTVAAGSSPDLVAASIALGSRGLVLALPGCGSVPDTWVSAITNAEEQGIHILKVSRTWGAKVPLPALNCRPLTPAQGRIALQLAMATNS